MKSKIHILYIIIDLILILLCLYLPYVYRYNSGTIKVARNTFQWHSLYLPALGQYSLIFLFWTIIIVLLFNMYNLYTTDRSISYLDEVILILKALFLAILPAAGAVFFFQVKLYSRLVFALNAVSLLAALSLWRIIKRYLIRRRVARGFNNLHVLIIGAGKVGQTLAREIERNPYLGLEVVGFIDDYKKETVGGYPVLGSSRDFERITRKYFVDEVLISIPSARDLVSRLISIGRTLGVSVRVVPDLFSLAMEGIKARYLGAIPLLEYYEKGLHGTDLILKRVFDIVVSAAALILLSPLMLFLGLAIKVDSPGPVFYVSKRCGRKSKVFNFYKFRSMVRNADAMLKALHHKDESDGPVFKMKKDPRVTGFGRFLRRFSLDELPQLWNVLKGDMSLVGPRPPTPGEVEEYHNWQLKRLDIRPGITCLWQIRGRSDLSFREWMKLDLFYIENWSFWLDIKILLATLAVVIRGKGAY